MGDGTGIEWTDATWNPTRGCSRLSPGCGGPNHQGGCYAEKIAARFSGPGQAFEGFAERTQHGGRWTGKMAVAWDAVDQPIRWRKPRHIFANSMSDLFHKDLPRDEVAVIYGTAIAAVHLRGHIIQILTKRADHMRETLNDESFWDLANSHAESIVLDHVDPHDRRRDDARATLDDYGPDKPAPGIWLGVSTEDQATADERIPDLMATPAAIRFISAEPLLGPVNVTWALSRNRMDIAAGFLKRGKFSPGAETLRPLDWVITGGESGPHARPANPDWFRSLRDQCVAAEVSFFFKQWGEWAPGVAFGMREDGPVSDSKGNVRDWMNRYVTCEDRADRVRSHSFTQHATNLVYRVGKARAGATLDGREWREMPS